MASTFISYRREDSAGYAGRLHEALERRLGQGRIFRDVDTLQPGHDFARAIEDRLRECRVFLALAAARISGGCFPRLPSARRLKLQWFSWSSWLPGSQSAAREQAGSNPQLPESSQGAARGSAYARSRSPLPPGSVRQSRRCSCVSAQDVAARPRHPSPGDPHQSGRVRAEARRGHADEEGRAGGAGAAAKLNREIGSRADEAPAVRIVIGGNIPLDGMMAVTPPALPPTDPDAIVDP
jgi:TIR domain